MSRNQLSEIMILQRYLTIVFISFHLVCAGRIFSLSLFFHLKGYLLTESISFLVFFVASWFWIPIYGAIGAVISFAATYVVYFLALVVYFRKVIFKA